MAISGVGGTPQHPSTTQAAKAAPSKTTSSAPATSEGAKMIAQAMAEIKNLIGALGYGHTTPAIIAKLKSAYEELRGGIMMLPAKDAGLHAAAMGLLGKIDDLEAPSGSKKQSNGLVVPTGTTTLGQEFNSGHFTNWVQDLGWGDTLSTHDTHTGAGWATFHNQLSALALDDIPAVERLL